MQRISKRFLALCLGILAVLLVAVICFTPKQIISSPYTVSDGISADTDICVTFVSFNKENITDKIDHAELVDLLSKYSFRRFAATSFTPPSDNAWEITLNQGGKSLHIIVGESDKQAIFYSNSAFMHRIIKSDSLWQELHSLIG